MQIAGFHWDEGNKGKCRKHGVSRAEIEGLFAGRVMILPDDSFAERGTAQGNRQDETWQSDICSFHDPGPRWQKIHPAGQRSIHA